MMIGRGAYSRGFGVVLTVVVWLDFYVGLGSASSQLNADCFSVFDHTKGVDVFARLASNVSALHECHFWCRAHPFEECSAYQYNHMSGLCELFDQEQTRQWTRVENQTDWVLVDLKARCYDDDRAEDGKRDRVKRYQQNGWTAWSGWSQCSAPCGSGLKTRSRQCTTYGGCQRYGGSSDVQECNAPVCRANWSPWSNWCECSCTCGGGTQSRGRSCSARSRCGGGGGGCGAPNPCGYGGNQETRRCSDNPCAQWSMWGEWCPCSSTCGGGGSQTRQRACSVSNQCPGRDREDRSCGGGSCCGEWCEWSECSGCGSGEQTRDRKCGYRPEEDRRPCQPQSYVPKCGTHWTSWVEWGDCSASCGGGIQSRTRQCHPPGSPPHACTGKGMETTECNEVPCASPPGPPATTVPSTVQSTVPSTVAPTTTPQVTTPAIEWGEWEAWSECSVTCGMGTRTRTHSCKGEGCAGNTTETETCERGPCPFWNEWVAWTDCTVTCGDGTKTRQRNCNGTGCTGDFKEITTCQRGPCPSWSEWVAWTDCSVTCDMGTRTRTRYCNGGNCTGNSTQTDKCDRGPCPTWTEWIAWTDCSVTCGNGTRTRTRICAIYSGTEAPALAPSRVKRFTAVDEGNCTGNSNDTEDCTDGPCPSWTPWGSWGPCPVTCGNATQVRVRECLGDDCQGNTTEAQHCDTGPCYAWSSWSEWSDCTVLCGGGSRNRSRQCPEMDECPGLDDDSDICNMMPCPDWGDWSPYTECSVSCGGGTRSRTRSCPLPEACSPGEAYDTDPSPCNPEACPEWQPWSDWSTCSKTCGEGNRRRSRPCSNGTDCLGPSETVEPCFIKLCTLSTTWSQWSPCTATCGGGTQTRSKAKCPSGPPTCDAEEDTQDCNSQPCPLWSEWTPWSQCSKTCGGGQRNRQRTCPIPFGCVGQPTEIDSKPCNAQGCEVPRNRTRTTPVPAV